MNEISVIVPTLNEENSLAATLAALARLGDQIETIVADGGSDDRTTNIARHFGARVIQSERGRGTQMHQGARAARGEIFWFIHADTVVPPSAAAEIGSALRDALIVGGNFEVSFSGQSRPARLMTWLYPKLGKLGLCYGDSGIFVRASVYREIGGFKPLPLFEDLDLIRRLKKRGRMVHLPVELVTSSRRFEGRNFGLTFARWSILQTLYWAGVPPRALNRLYAPVRKARERAAG